MSLNDVKALWRELDARCAAGYGARGRTGDVEAGRQRFRCAARALRLVERRVLRLTGVDWAVPGAMTP